MVLRIEATPADEPDGTLAWVLGGAWEHYKRQAKVAAAVLTFSLPMLGVVSVAIVAGWLQYGWLALALWVGFTVVQAASELRTHSVSIDWPDGGPSRRGGGSSSSTAFGSKLAEYFPVEFAAAAASFREQLAVLLLALGGVQSFLVAVVIAGELGGWLFGPVGVLVGAIAVFVAEGLLNERGDSLATPGIAGVQTVLVALWDLSALQRRQLTAASRDLGGLFEQGVLGIWRVG